MLASARLDAMESSVGVVMDGCSLEDSVGVGVCDEEVSMSEED